MLNYTVKFVFRMFGNKVAGKYVLTKMGWWFIPCNVISTTINNDVAVPIIEELP